MFLEGMMSPNLGFADGYVSFSCYFFLSPGAVESIKMLVEFFGGVFLFFLFSNSGD